MTSRAASRTSPTVFDTGHEARGPTSRPQELRRHRSVSLRSPGGAAHRQRPPCLGARQQAVKSAEPGCGHRSGSCPPWRQTDHIRLNTRIGRMMSAQTTIEENRPSGFSIGAGGGSTRGRYPGIRIKISSPRVQSFPGGRAHRLHARNRTEDHQQLGEVKPAKARRTPYLSERCRSI